MVERGLGVPVKKETEEFVACFMAAGEEKEKEGANGGSVEKEGEKEHKRAVARSKSEGGARLLCFGNCPFLVRGMKQA